MIDAQDLLTEILAMMIFESDQRTKTLKGLPTPEIPWVMLSPEARHVFRQRLTEYANAESFIQAIKR